MNESTHPAPPSQPRRVGRPAGSRTGHSPAREQILKAARRQFAQGSYSATTVRAIAAEAGVNPALVIHHFGSKRDLFVATLHVPANLHQQIADLIRTDAADMGHRLARLYLGLWQDPVTRAPIAAMVRSVISDTEATEAFGQFMTAALVGPVVAAMGRDQPQLRISLVASQLIGMAIGRHILGITPLAKAEVDHLVACIAPVLQHYLTDPLPTPPR
ncbi:TetR family transcriptional regulator [Streptacidiphilus sp. N1-10]|uniref:TetR family transcriptional regulator n=1 Tax=Streptacidiphilus jeojiensis TaxID=3229225 RepID=A0ABV6XX97_9ACTN